MSRTILLPDNLQSTAWVSLGTAIDAVFQVPVDDKIAALKTIRNTLVLSAAALTKISADQMLSGDAGSSDLDLMDKSTVVKQVKLQGLSFPDPSILTKEQYARFVQYLPQFWYGKGRGDVADFLSFVLNTDIGIESLWTQDYVNFFPEGDPAIDFAIHQGGKWYPTTSLRLSYDFTAAAVLNFRDLIKLFYEVANYTLVVQSVMPTAKMPIGNSTELLSFPKSVATKNVALGFVVVNNLTIKG